MTLEAAALKALEKALASAASQVGKRLWTGRLSPTARRARACEEAIALLMRHDFSDRFRLSVVLPELPAGISLKDVRTKFGGPVYEGLMHELVAARVMGMPAQTVLAIRENMAIATRLEFPGADPAKAAELGGLLFDESDRVVRQLVEKLNGLNEKGLTELRQHAAVALLTATRDGIARHNAYLTRGAAVAPDWEDTYRSQVRHAHGYIAPPDFERKRRIPIRSLFVSPRILSRTRGDQTSVDTVQALWNAIDRTVLLGDPGGGKSTISNLFAHHAAGDTNLPIPFVVTLRAVGEQSIVGHIEAELSRYYQCPAPQDVVEGLLLSGRAVVIFDGLDELVDTSRRREVTDRVELFCNRYPLTKVLVTSRRVGYDEAALDPSVFEGFELAEFSEAEVESYVGKWFVQMDDADEAESSKLTKAFMLESEAVPDLRANPLMLALMCIIYRGQHWIPRNRADMYKRCAELLFDQWDRNRRIYVDLKAGAHVDGAIKQLAYWMFTTPGAAGGIRETDLVREATSFLEPVFGVPAEAEVAAKQFIDFCRGRGWVLTDVGSTGDGESLFAFTHRTFMEYFAAYELTRMHDGPEQLANALWPHIASAEWQIVAELAVQISNKHAKDGAARLLTRLLDNLPSFDLTTRRNVSRFAMRCLEFISVPASLTERIAETYMITATRLPAQPYDESEYWEVLPEVQAATEAGFSRALRTAITTGTKDQQNAAAEIAFSLPTLMRRRYAGPDGDTQRWNSLIRALFTEFRETVLTDPTEAVLVNAWAFNLISMQELLTINEATSDYPLTIIFKPIIGTHTRGMMAPIAPPTVRRCLESDNANRSAGNRFIQALGEYLDQLGHPPLVQGRQSSMVRDLMPGIEIDPEVLTTELGWTLLRLMLIEAETAADLDSFEEEDGESRNYDVVLTHLMRIKEEGYGEPPQWLAKVFDQLQPDRQELVDAWLYGDLDFVAPG